MRVALIGAQGFVGTAIRTALSRKPDVDLVPVTRESCAEAARDGHYDLVIHSAMPSKRYHARKFPRTDFAESVEKTSRLIDEFSSARSQLDTPYGRHRAAAEKLCEFGDNLVVRLGPMYAESLTKGVLVDIAKSAPVYVSRESRYSFAPLHWVASWIAANLDASGVVELGAANAIEVGAVADAVGSLSTFSGPTDHQEPIRPIPGAPESADVIAFVRTLLSSAT